MGRGVFFIFILVVAVLALIIHGYHRAKARTAALAAWAAAKGFYFNKGKFSSFADEHPMLSCLRNGHDLYAYNVASGEWGDVVFTSFDYHYATGSGKSRNDHHMSGVLLRPNFPLQPLLVRKEGFFDKMKAGFGHNDIDFESAEFSKRFFVAAKNKSWAYDVLHARTIEFLLISQPYSHLNLDFECNHQVLCILTRKQNEIPEIERAYKFGKTILDGIPDYAKQNQA